MFALMILGCNQNLKKNFDIIGTWDVVSTTNIETGEVLLPESNHKDFVEFKSDSLYLSSGEVFAWSIEGDSIFLEKSGAAYIKTLTKKELIVEYNFLSKIQLTLKRRK